MVWVTAFGLTYNSAGGIDTDATIGAALGMNYFVYVPPQMTVELTCFELPKTFNGTIYNYVARWLETNHYISSIPQVIAMGKVTNLATSPGATIEGKSIFGNSFSVSRNGTTADSGIYTITLPYNFRYVSSPLVLLTGVGYTQGTTQYPIKATLLSISGRTLKVACSDDDTINGGSFSFVIYNYGGINM